MGEIDVLASFAWSTVTNPGAWCVPTLLRNDDGDDEDEENAVNLIDAWHPLVASCVPNTIDSDVVALTGHNRTGKSTVLRVVGACVFLAQIGSLVPARRARMRTFERIWTRSGTVDHLHLQNSTFVVEMTRLGNIATYSNANHLVLLDEICANTNAAHGAALAVALVHDLRRRGVATFVATHYDLDLPSATMTEQHKLVPGQRTQADGWNFCAERGYISN